MFIHLHLIPACVRPWPIILLADVSNEMWVAIFLLRFERKDSLSFTAKCHNLYGFLSCLLSIKSQKDNNNNNNKKRIKKAEQREPNGVHIARRHSPRERNVNDTDQRVWRSCVHGRVERYYSIVATTAARDIPFSCYDYLFRSWTVKKKAHLMKTKQTHTQCTKS